jgi:hypothetical protein
MVSKSTIDFPGYDNLYAVGDPFQRRYAFAEIVRADEIRQITPELLLARRETLVWTPVGGKLIGDFVWTAFLPIVLVSPRVVISLQSVGASGWQAWPAICGSDPKCADYQWLSVIGKCGRIDNERGVWERHDEAPGPWKSVLRGIYFEEVTWDGSDVFAPEESKYVVVTDKVRAALRSASCSNVRFRKLSEVQTPEIVVRSSATGTQ